MLCHGCRNDADRRIFERCMYCHTPGWYCVRCMGQLTCSDCLKKALSPSLVLERTPYRESTIQPCALAQFSDATIVSITVDGYHGSTCGPKAISTFHPPLQKDLKGKDAFVQTPPNVLTVYASDEPVKVKVKAFPPNADVTFSTTAGCRVVKTGANTADVFVENATWFGLYAFFDKARSNVWKGATYQGDPAIDNECVTMLIHGLENQSNLPRLLVDSGDEGTGYFYLSNESDWPGIKPGRKSDVVISFSNNVGWDQVVESQGKCLVLCDWASQPLIVQEKLFRPLIVSSQTPAVFLSRVLGVPVTDEHDPYDLISVCQELYDLDGEIRTAIRKEFCLKEYSSICETCDKLGLVIDRDYLKRYFDALAARGSEAYREYPFPANVIGGRYRAAKKNPDLACEFFGDLAGRYARKINSCLSSASNYSFLQSIFKDALYYARGDILKSSLLEAVGMAFCETTYALNVSNVMQASWEWGGDKRKINLPSYTANKLVNYVLKSLNVPLVDKVHLLITVGSGTFHEYYDLVISTEEIEAMGREIFDRVKGT